VTPDPLVGKELQRTAADFPLRQRLATLKVRSVTESAIVEWTGEGCRVLSLLDWTEQFVTADSLVLATVNRAEDTLWRSLLEHNVGAVNIGDSAAPRLAPFAIHDGRKAGMAA